MRRVLLLVVLMVACGRAAAADLVVAGSTDRSAMEPLIRSFEAANPDARLVYVERETVGLYQEILDGTLVPAPDVVISSAVDLQIRLVNDGFTRAYRSPATARLPEWARWRDEAFGFTFEPLVFVVNPTPVPPAAVPRTREALARLASTDRAVHGRVATYDVAQSGIGYLVAGFDAASMSDYWPFVARIGAGGLMTACCTVDVVDLVASGRAAVGYNVLGSYARGRQAAGARIEIVYPEDFMFVIARVALIMKDARAPALAERFVDFLLSGEAQNVFAHEALLSAIDEGVAGGLGQRSIRAAARGPIRPIELDATLLAMTDPLRRERFIALWKSVVDGRE